MNWPPGNHLTDTITQSDGTRIQTVYEWNNGSPYASHQIIDSPSGHTEMSFRPPRHAYRLSDHRRRSRDPQR